MSEEGINNDTKRASGKHLSLTISLNTILLPLWLLAGGAILLLAYSIHLQLQIKDTLATLGKSRAATNTQLGTEPAPEPNEQENTPSKIELVPRIITPQVEVTPPTPPSFVWPAKGRIIGGFGKRPDGTENDGVNIALEPGTEVKAAEAGVVAYAGNELKAYGNVVLLRHNDGWVTAYAHNDAVLVKRGDQVKQGHIIARSGSTGSAKQPQLHFEVRYASKPVDPLKYLSRD